MIEHMNRKTRLIKYFSGATTALDCCCLQWTQVKKMLAMARSQRNRSRLIAEIELTDAWSLLMSCLTPAHLAARAIDEALPLSLSIRGWTLCSQEALTDTSRTFETQASTGQSWVSVCCADALCTERRKYNLNAKSLFKPAKNVNIFQNQYDFYHKHLFGFISSIFDNTL